MELIKVDHENGIALVTIERPKALNALNAQVLEELAQVFQALAKDSSIGGVIITGSGEKSFVAGADIKELASLDPITAKTVSTFGQGVFRAIECFEKPVIAAINGFALGGGCELALACHLRFAASNAKLGLPEVGLGLIPGYGGTQRLPRLIGKGLALELILTGGMISAQRAHDIGLVNELCEPAALLDRCRAVLRTIMSKGPLAVRFAIEAVNHGLEMGMVDGERQEANLFALLATTNDCKEGLTAFIEKREAKFQAR